MTPRGANTTVSTAAWIEMSIPMIEVARGSGSPRSPRRSWRRSGPECFEEMRVHGERGAGRIPDAVDLLRRLRLGGGRRGQEAEYERAQEREQGDGRSHAEGASGPIGSVKVKVEEPGGTGLNSAPSIFESAARGREKAIWVTVASE
jgi:hypothetical protein